MLLLLFITGYTYKNVYTSILFSSLTVKMDGKIVYDSVAWLVSIKQNTESFILSCCDELVLFFSSLSVPIQKTNDIISYERKELFAMFCVNKTRLSNFGSIYEENKNVMILFLGWHYIWTLNWIILDFLKQSIWILGVYWI